MAQGLAVAAIIAAAAGYLLWYWRKGRKKPSCPDCIVHEKVAAARRQNRPR
jgi:hypothetical protein